MAKVDIINLQGEKVKEITLNKDIWGITVNEVVLKKAVDLQLASLRQGTQKAKTRAEVSGGGRKPYRQKGTGNARQGTIRAPHYRGGGIVFAPTPRNYTFKMNKKERVLALKSALTLKAENLVVVNSLEMSSLKTRDIKSVITKLNLAGKVLFISASDAENLFMATRNLEYAMLIMVNEVNVYDLINADTVVIEEAAVSALEEVLK